jgi:hypothetical protein
MIPKMPILGLDLRMEAGFGKDHAQDKNLDYDARGVPGGE